MPDKRISELTPMVTPAGTDEFPCNQGGVTMKATRTQITAAVAADLATHMASSPATHANNSITNALLRDSAGVSVIGRASGSSGDPADIVAGADSTVLSRKGGTLAFRDLDVSYMTDGTEVATIPVFWAEPGGNVVDVLDDGVTTYGRGYLRIPADYVSGGTVKWIGRAAGTGNIYRRITVYGGANGQVYTTHSTAVAWGTVAMVVNQWTEIASVDISAWLAAGDNIYLEPERDATNILDTIGAEVWAYAYFTYTANHGG